MLTQEITSLDYGKVRQRIVSFMKNELVSSGKNGFVVGLSGGLDSSVTVALAREATKKVHALILPSYGVTPTRDIDDAIGLCKRLKVKYEIIDLSEIHSNMVRKMRPNKLASGNLLARLRMCTLYYYANLKNMLVLGTSDRSELLIGYFTKYGDGAADILPIASLYKIQVRAFGYNLRLPSRILTKKIAPMLWKKHLAEDEIGMPYEEIDSILYCMFDKKYSPQKTAQQLQIPIRKVMKIRKMYENSMHKREMPKICILKGLIKT
ncbi:MAG: NAD+ synthase [Nitrososphaerales archaeon]